MFTVTSTASDSRKDFVRAWSYPPPLTTTPSRNAVAAASKSRLRIYYPSKIRARLGRIWIKPVKFFGEIVKRGCERDKAFSPGPRARTPRPDKRRYDPRRAACTQHIDSCYPDRDNRPSAA